MKMVPSTWTSSIINCSKGLLPALLIALLPNIISSQESDFPSADAAAEATANIDTLISVLEINGNSLLVRLGSDAITAINTEKGLVVIDAGISTGLSLRYKTIIERYFPGKAVKFVINTHAHPDHYGGNAAFSDATVIGQENGPGEIDSHWKDTTRVIRRIQGIIKEYELLMQNYEENSADWNQAFMEKLRYQYALEDTKGPGFIRKPSLTFADSLRLDLEDMVIEMKHFGICHSKSDLLIYVPELKLLFTGDLFFKYGRPSINYEQNRDKAQWLSAVQWIQARTSDIETIIGGHGELLSKEDLTRFTQLIIEE